MKRNPRLPAAIACLFLNTLLLGCGVKYVSFSEAEEVGDNYFRVLKTGETSAVMRLYSSEFTTPQYRVQWADFLDQKMKNWGSCVNHTLEGKLFFPRVKSDDANVPADICFAMKYAVSYTTLKVHETLTLCPDPVDSVLRIAGHKLEREGKKPVSAGMSQDTVGTGNGN